MTLAQLRSAPAFLRHDQTDSLIFKEIDVVSLYDGIVLEVELNIWPSKGMLFEQFIYFPFVHPISDICTAVMVDSVFCPSGLRDAETEADSLAVRWPCARRKTDQNRGVLGSQDCLSSERWNSLKDLHSVIM